MSYRLLALDLDGTLLRTDGSIHERDLEAIARVQRRGVHVTLVTGRLYSGTVDVARRAGVAGPVACVDGSHIVDAADDTDLVHNAIVGDDARRMRDILERHDAASFLFAQDRIVHDDTGLPYLPYVRTWSPLVDHASQLFAHPFWEHERGVLAVVAVGTEAQIRGACAALTTELSRAAFVLSFAVRRYDDRFALVARAAGSTKGTAIDWLATHHGCSADEVVAVGDWLNDVPMFQVAGRSFCMGQAPSAVSDAATDQLDATNITGGGVAEAVARAWQ